MNAAVTLHLRDRLPGIARGLSPRVTRASTLQRVVGLTVLVAATLGAAAMLGGPRAMAYLGVFGGGVVTSAILFLPSGRWAILIGGALVLDPWLVAAMSGVGGAIGELSAYVVGRSSRKVIKQGRTPAWLSRLVERRMGLMVLLVSTIPNPFVDVIGIVAGRARYAIGRYLAFTTVGKVIQNLVLVSMVLWNVSLFSHWIDVG